MSLIEQIVINKKLPFEASYIDELKEREYLESSYNASGAEYLDGNAPDGPIIHRQECEEDKDYSNRKSQTPLRAYVSSLLNKYNAAVFKNEPVRQATSATLELLYRDADTYGNSLNKLMKKALLENQKFGSCYIMADSTASNTEVLTIAQATSAEVRPYLRIIPNYSVVNYVEVEEKLLEVIVLLEDESGNTFARYMDSQVYVDITLGKQNIVTSVSEPYSHGYSKIPIVELESFEVPQALPIANSQRVIVNTLSLLQQEMNDAVFTKWILSGTRLPEDGDDQKKISWSGKRMVVIESETAKLQLLGADHGCADSLRKQIEQEETQMLYQAGFGRPNIEPTALSGLSRLIALEDFFNIAGQLTHCAENAENYILEVICEKEGLEYVPTVYSTKYIADDNGEELAKLRDLMALELPQSFKSLAIRNYINTFYNVSKEDMDRIEEELLQGSLNA